VLKHLFFLTLFIKNCCSLIVRASRGLAALHVQLGFAFRDNEYVASYAKAFPLGEGGIERSEMTDEVSAAATKP